MNIFKIFKISSRFDYQNTRESYKDSSSSRNNGNISLKSRLSGFATSNYNSNRYESSTSHRSSRSDRNRFAYDYERNRGYERETYVKRNQDYKTERKPVDTRRRNSTSSKFSRRQEEALSEDSNSDDSNDSKSEFKKRLSSFVSTSTIASRTFSKI